MLTVAAFVLIGLLVVAACETTRGWFLRVLDTQDLQPVHPAAQPAAELGELS